MPAPLIFKTAALTAALALAAAGLMDRTPGGSAVQSGFVVGDRLAREAVHLIERPGLYGLAEGLPGSRYAVAAGQLIRIDATSLQVQSILREQDEILD